MTFSQFMTTRFVLFVYFCGTGLSTIYLINGGRTMKQRNEFEFEAQNLEYENVYNEESDRDRIQLISSIWYS